MVINATENSTGRGIRDCWAEEDRGVTLDGQEGPEIANDLPFYSRTGRRQCGKDGGNEGQGLELMSEEQWMGPGTR